jgi:crossover junction endodeoxyribonuclease RuvC
MSERIILGIDPGTNIMGYGIIKVSSLKFKVSSPNNSNIPQSLKNKNREIELIKLDVIKLNNLKDHALKLKNIFETTLSLLDEYKPDELAIEAPFFGKNIQSMLKLGRAQGVAMAAALYREIPIFEYSPRKIKQSITGNGSASKEQVSALLISMLNMSEAPEYLDATDGLAAAVCHYFQSQNPNMQSQNSKYTGWKAFITENPKRVKS